MYATARALIRSVAAIVGVAFASSSVPCLAEVEVDGNLLYRTLSSELRVYDVSDPLNRTEIGTWQAASDDLYFNDLEIAGQHAYVADGYTGLIIFDVSDPTTPTFAGWYYLAGWANHVEVDNGLAYVADLAGGLWVLDVSDTQSPQFVGFAATVGDSLSVEVADGLAYLTTRLSYGGPGTLSIFDVSNPASPYEVGRLDGGKRATDLEVTDGLAYLGVDEVRVVDVSVPASPVQVGDLGSPQDAWDVEIAGDRAYVVDWLESRHTDDVIRVIDITDPLAPVELGTLPYPNAGDIAVSGNTVHGRTRSWVLAPPGAGPCADGLDNDGDYRIDLSDVGCDDADDPSEEVECRDELDNDGDGLIDLADSGCDSEGDLSEEFACSDGRDNDGDGLLDAGDPACRDQDWNEEHSLCQDGINNDLEQDPNPGLIDFDGGQSIHGVCAGGVCPPGVSDPDGDGVADPDPQCVGKPWSNREARYPCGIGSFELALILPGLMWLHRRRRRVH
jgi:hypothetical protein